MRSIADIFNSSSAPQTLGPPSTVVLPPTDRHIRLIFRDAETPIERMALVCAIAQTSGRQDKPVEACTLDSIIDLMVEGGYDQFDARVAVAKLSQRGSLKLREEHGETWVSVGVQWLTEARS